MKNSSYQLSLKNSKLYINTNSSDNVNNYNKSIGKSE